MTENANGRADGEGHWRCSDCGVTFDEGFDVCPECGARSEVDSTEPARDEPSVWASSWSVADPRGPLHALRWLTLYFAFLSFVVPMAMILLGVGVFPAYEWLVYWWPWTLFLIVVTWTLDNVIEYLRTR